VASERRVPSAEEAELGLVELLQAVRFELIPDYYSRARRLVSWAGCPSGDSPSMDLQVERLL
jgi:hypothetical protein